MQKQAFIKVVIVMLAFAGYIRADVSVIVNGSFEEDGVIGDIAAQEPNGWDVNLPPNQFDGWVFDEWVTDGSYNLTFYSDSYQAFEVNDMATLSQEVILWDVNNIIFDIRLDTQSALKVWDPNKRTAVLMIDDEVVWESNDVGLDVRGEYFNQTVNVSGLYDAGSHKLSLGLRADVNEGTTSIKYYTDWDFIRFDFHCDGFGFLAGDFNRDCYVDFVDFAELVEVWRAEVQPMDERNLFEGDDTEPNGFINFYDFALYAGNYTGDMNDFAGFTEIWLEEVEANNEYNLFTADQAEPNGVINFFDLAVFAEDWGRSSYD